MSKHSLSRLLFLASIVLFSACGSGDDSAGTGDPVTVSGIVANIDDGSIAEGVKVYLIDHESDIVSETTTGADGAFSVEVPAGSDFLLVTDDFDSADDAWIPTINFDPIHKATIEEATSDIIIHACPKSSGTQKGSVAALDNYLENATENAGLFDVTSVATGKGVLLVFIESNSGGFGLTTGISLESDDTDCKVGYVSPTAFYDENLIPDPALGPNAFLPSTTESTDGSGTAAIFCSDSSSFQMTLSDTDTARALDFGGPYDVPVRTGAVTLVIGGSIDGVGRKTFAEVATAAGLL